LIWEIQFTIAAESRGGDSAEKKVLVNTYERNPVARQVCIDHYGASCMVCDFDFEKTFGGIGKGFIHIHHIVDLATIGEEYSVDPTADLIPVCPNCHAMLHRQRPAYGIDELRKILNEKKRG
jgi:5-methylcytosine-specific restriction enzyme A